MAFDFGAGLSAIGQLYPAAVEGQEIRRQRQADAAAVSQRAQAAQDTHAASQAQVERERALTAQDTRNANRYTPISSKPERGEDGKYYMLFLSPDNKIQRLPVEGDYDPLADKKRLAEAVGAQPGSDLYTQIVGGIKPTLAQPVLRQAADGTYEWIEKPGAGIPSGKAPTDATSPTPGVISTGVQGRIPGASDSTSSHYDPVTGTTSTTHTVRKPLIPGQTPSTTRGGPTPTGGDTTRPTAGGAPASPNALDAQGNIPARTGLNEYVRAAANELLHDKDINQIEARLRPMARALAEKYGWSQGAFTPIQQKQVKEAATFINAGLNSPLLSVLDSPLSRQKLAAISPDPSKEGFTGRQMNALAIQSLSPQEKEYLNMYNQMLGTVSGLSSLVRSNRATEQTINRLKNELPDPISTQSSADAKNKLNRLMQEIRVALSTGGFRDAQSGGTSAPTSTQPTANDPLGIR